jgi:ABC-type glutathione transport system ATPase component
MTIERLQAHWGFSRMPFSRDLAPGMLVATRSHAEAVARISWLISESALGIVTGEVGAGKTVAARAATAALDHRHLVIYLGNPAAGVRGYYRHIERTPEFVWSCNRNRLMPDQEVTGSDAESDAVRPRGPPESRDCLGFTHEHPACSAVFKQATPKAPSACY